LPTAPTGEFDVLALFSSPFAERYGFADPAAPTRALSLCELFEQGIEAMWEALPSLAADARAFLNRDFDTRFGVRLKSWAEICDLAGTPCVEYPTPQSARGSYPDDGTPWSIAPFQQGCGSTRFPPNARARGDMVNAAPVDSRCAHFGLGDWPGGGDAYEPYSAGEVAALDQAFPDCGGGWQIYWRQSIPGYGTRARGADGAPMKNWWPLLFY
jgi:hypothetical protein